MNESGTKPLISIVLPIYNVSDYLSKCLDSIIKQTYTNLEILLIDDGSTDGCYDICEKYQSKDQRFKVIHKKNGGVSSARNCGIRAMTGKYMTFIDPDDMVAPDYVETLYRSIKENNSEISICGVKTVFSEDLCVTDAKDRRSEVFTAERAIEKMLYQDEIDVNAWGKMYLSSLFDGIEYPTGKINEDTAITYKVFAKAHIISFDSYKCYFYMQHPESIMHQSFAVRKMTLIEFSRECLQFIEKYFPDIRSAAVCKHVTDSFVLICKIYECTPLDRESLAKCWAIAKKYRLAVIRDPKSRRKTKIACLASYLGPHFVAFSKGLNARRDERRGVRDI